jgi:uncharacterized protein (UPF0332 family)
MPLDKKIQELIDKGYLKKETIRDDQIAEHLRRAKKDLETARANLAIDEEAAYNYAYLGMLRAGRALMFCDNYRPDDGSQHWTVCEFARIVLPSEARKIADYFDDMRRKRNMFTYDPGIPVSLTEANDALRYAKQFMQSVLPEVIKKRPGIKL